MSQESQEVLACESKSVKQEPAEDLKFEYYSDIGNLTLLKKEAEQAIGSSPTPEHSLPYPILPSGRPGDFTAIEIKKHNDQGNQNFPQAWQGGCGVDPYWTGGSDPRKWAEWVQYRKEQLALGNTEGLLEPWTNKERGKEFVLHTHSYSSLPSLTLWHNRMGHLNFESVAKIIKRPLPPKGIFCPSCCQGKSTLVPAPKSKGIRATRIGELIHSDMGGPIEVQTPSGKKYFLIFVDDFSRRLFIRLLPRGRGQTTREGKRERQETLICQNSESEAEDNIGRRTRSATKRATETEEK